MSWLSGGGASVFTFGFLTFGTSSISSYSASTSSASRFRPRPPIAPLLQNKAMFSLVVAVVKGIIQSVNHGN